MEQAPGYRLHVRLKRFVYGGEADYEPMFDGSHLDMFLAEGDVLLSAWGYLKSELSCRFCFSTKFASLLALIPGQCLQ